MARVPMAVTLLKALQRDVHVTVTPTWTLACNVGLILGIMEICVSVVVLLAVVSKTGPILSVDKNFS